MADPFAVFNRTSILSLERSGGQTSGHYGSDDVWVPASGTAAVPIEGHITTVDRRNAESQWSPTPGSPMETGEMRFFTATLLDKGDVLALEQDDGAIYRYRVISLVRPMRLMSKVLGIPLRYEYIIAEVPR